jgi:hypothetical protein
MLSPVDDITARRARRIMSRRVAAGPTNGRAARPRGCQTRALQLGLPDASPAYLSLIAAGESSTSLPRERVRGLRTNTAALMPTASHRARAKAQRAARCRRRRVARAGLRLRGACC